MNSGDIETDFILTVKKINSWTSLMDEEGKAEFITSTKELVLHKLEKIESECLQFDSKNKLIKGGTYDEENKKFIPDGKIYNFLIKNGDFPRLKVGETSFIVLPLIKEVVTLLEFKHKHYYYI